jgi:phage-related protein
MGNIFMKWKINYYNQSIKEDARALPKSIKAKFEAIKDKMLEHGPELGLPFIRAMGKGLFEIRAKGQEGIARGLFCIISKNTIVILHIFIKKTEATPKKELDLAIKRLKEVKNHDL